MHHFIIFAHTDRHIVICVRPGVTVASRHSGAVRVVTDKRKEGNIWPPFTVNNSSRGIVKTDKKKWMQMSNVKSTAVIWKTLTIWNTLTLQK